MRARLVFAAAASTVLPVLQLRSVAWINGAFILHCSSTLFPLLTRPSSGPALCRCIGDAAVKTVSAPVMIHHSDYDARCFPPPLCLCSCQVASAAYPVARRPSAASRSYMHLSLGFGCHVLCLSLSVCLSLSLSVSLSRALSLSIYLSVCVRARGSSRSFLGHLCVCVCACIQAARLSGGGADGSGAAYVCCRYGCCLIHGYR